MAKKQKSVQTSKLLNKSQSLCLLFLLIYTILSILLFDPKLFTGGDNAVYIILAESISQGNGYKNIYMPDQPPHTQYPFGFPLLIALCRLIFGTNLIAFKILVFLTGLGTMYFIYQINKYLFNNRVSIIMPLFLSIPIFIIYNHWVLSEMPFLFFSLGALYFFIKAQKNKNIYYYLSFSLATYSFFIRTAGISLILAMMLILLIKKEFRHLAILLFIFLAVFVPWQIRNLQIPNQGSYIDQLLAKNPYQMELGRVSFYELLVRVWDNFILYFFTILPMTILPLIKASALLTITGLLFTIFTIIGFMVRIKKIMILEAYLIFGIIILVTWPRVWSSDRFLLPILPVLVIYILFAIIWLAEKIKSKYFMPVVGGIIVMLNILPIFSLAKEAITNNIGYLKGDEYTGYSPDWKNYFEVINFIKKNIPIDKIVMARKPEFVFLLSQHKSFSYPFTTNRDEVKSAIAKTDYILFDSFYWTGTSMRYLLPVLQENIQDYEIIYQTKKPPFYLLKTKNKI